MPFLANDHVSIPTKDILSWAQEGHFDRNKPLYIDAVNPFNSVSAAQATIIIKQLIAGFRNAGLKKGDTVLVHSFNNIYYPIIVLGIIGFGGVYAGTNPSYTSHEMKHAITASGAKLLISEPEILESATNAAREVEFVAEKVFILDTTDVPTPHGHQSWRSLLKHGEQDWVAFDDEETSINTTAMLLFSSGTTGLPKPAILSHYNLIAQHTLVFEHRIRPYTPSRLIALPMFHAATAPSTHVSPLRSGHKQFIMRRFDTIEFLNSCEKFKITDLTLVPPMVTAIVAAPISVSEKKMKLRYTRAAIAGAAPLDKEMQARLQTLLPSSTPFTQLWGMTETTCFAALFYYPENDDTGSVGKFLPNLDVKLVNDNGKDITEYDTSGELWIRGPTVIKGYVGRDRKDDFDNDGYFRTGDVFHCDKDTNLWYIVDRKKELIKVRGFQVAPAEVEGVLLAHSEVRDAAVIGIPAEEGDSELPRAYVVKKDGSKLDERDVMAWMEVRLARYKRLEGGVKFVDVIPKTPSGKILKRVLREKAKREVGSRL